MSLIDSVCLALLGAVLAGCGSNDSSGSAAGGASSGGASSGGAPNGGASSGGASSGGGSGGSSAGGSSSGGTSSGGGGTATGGAAGACSATPGQVKCGDGMCDLKTQYCCGGPESGKCFAQGAFCGLGGGIRMACDDPADCASAEVCCVGEVPNPGSDAPYQTSCVKPKPQPEGNVYGCGTTPGGMPWEALCSCDKDCPFGTCKPGSITVPTTSASYSRCG